MEQIYPLTFYHFFCIVYLYICFCFVCIVICIHSFHSAHIFIVYNNNNNNTVQYLYSAL